MILFSFLIKSSTFTFSLKGSVLWLLYAISAEKAMALPLQYSCLENPMDRGAWWAAVHGVAKSWTPHFHALEKEMAIHSSILAWRIPGTGETGGLSSKGSHRVGHDWSDLALSSLPYLNSQHYNSHTLWPLLSRIRSICTQTLWYCNQLSIWQPWSIVSD